MNRSKHRKAAPFLLAVLLLALPAQAARGTSDGAAVPEVNFSLEAGAYPEDRIELELSAPEGYTVYYTTDGAVPTAESIRYVAPLLLTEEGSRWLDGETAAQLVIPGANAVSVSPELPGACVIRAVAMGPDGRTGRVTTKTYFPGRSLAETFCGAMVISIVTDPENLLGYETGILVPGYSYDVWKTSEGAREILSKGEWQFVEANFTQRGRRWERPASLELFDGSDCLTLQENGGIRVRGNFSRIFLQKSLAIYFRETYGQAYMDYVFFPGAGNAPDGGDITRYDGFLLRNGGNDTEYLKFKDGWLQSLVGDRAFTAQHDRPAIVFLNGEYWGVYNLMERIDAALIEARYGVRDVLIIKENELHEGREADFHLYEELMAYADQDLSDEAVWDDFRTIMDIRSLADYFAAEIYIGNCDWTPEQNIGLWRTVLAEPSSPYGDGRWRFILFDTEFSSALYSRNTTSPYYNSMEYAMGEHPLFAAALRNPEFRELFREAIREIGAINYAPETVNRTLAVWAGEWKPFMGDFYQRFSDTSWAWEPGLAGIKDYFSARYACIIPAVDAALEALEKES